MDARMPSPMEELIGFSTLDRPLESWYAFVSRLIRTNLLTDVEIRRQLPADWVRLAFAPHEVQMSDLLLKEVDCAGIPHWEFKLRPAAWVPFPDLASTPPECLRGCPTCLALGYHSYAMQGDLIARCPVHDEPLVHRCPHCQTPLLWQARSASHSAFHCPAGCLLTEGIHSGLGVPHEAAITRALQAHLKWTEQVRQAITFVSGPVHIAYPPHLARASLRMPPLPSPGLAPALLRALRTTELKAPAFAPYHERSSGLWRLTVKRWAPAPCAPQDEARLDRYRRAFRRGAYRTCVPLVERRAFEQWLADSEVAYGHRWHDGAVEEGGGCSVFAFPSYLVTNNELNALRRLLARGGDPALAAAHYQWVLADLLDHARWRRLALDQLDEPSRHVTVAEAVYGIARTSTGLWQMSGHTQGDDASRAAWRDFREPAELASVAPFLARQEVDRSSP